MPPKSASKASPKPAPKQKAEPTNGRANYNHKPGLKEAVWDKAKKIPGKDSNVVRKDPYGNEIRFKDYATQKQTGWEIDHIIPQSKPNSSDDIRNLQALQTKTNREKSDSLVKKSRHNQ